MGASLKIARIDRRDRESLVQESIEDRTDGPIERAIEHQPRFVGVHADVSRNGGRIRRQGPRPVHMHLAAISNDEYRTASSTDNLFGHAAHQQVGQSGPAVGGHDDEICSVIDCSLPDAISRCAVTHFTGDARVAIEASADENELRALLPIQLVEGCRGRSPVELERPSRHL
jgi:hypothetical protein